MWLNIATAHSETSNRISKKKLQNTAIWYKKILDNPNEDTFYDESMRLPEPIDTYTISSLSKIQCFKWIISKLLYWRKEKNTKSINYFIEERKKHLSDSRVNELEQILVHDNVLVVADNEMVEMQSKLLWAWYGAWSFWEICAFRSRDDIENRTHIVRHEVIHSKQIQDLGWWILWFIKWLIVSWIDLTKIHKEYKKLIPWSIDNATDNQITDWETYLNQPNTDYLTTRDPKGFLKIKTHAHKNLLVKEHLQDDLIQALGDAGIPPKDIQKMKDIASDHDNHSRSQVITAQSKDRFAYQETAQEHQLHFISDTALKKEIWLDAFITHYNPNKNYKEWSDLYQKYKSIIDPIIEQFVRTWDAKELEKWLNKIFDKISNY